LSEYKRFRAPPEPEEYLLSRLESLVGFDRLAYHYGKLLSITGSTTVKAVSPPIRRSTADLIVQYLRKIGAIDFESGKSTAEIAKALKLKQPTIQKAISDLVDRGLVKPEKRGRRIKYFLPKT